MGILPSSPPLSFIIETGLSSSAIMLLYMAVPKMVLKVSRGQGLHYNVSGNGMLRNPRGLCSDSQR